MKRTILVPILMVFAFSMTAGCGAGGSTKTGGSTMAEGGKSGKSNSEKSNSEKSGKSNQDGHDGDMKAMCPMDVAGTQVATEDIDGGVAIVFTTTGDVADLRARVSHLAEMHKEHAGHEHEGHEMPAADVAESDVDGGARLELKAADASAVDALRSHVEEHVAKMQSSGTCPHMGHDDDDKPQD